MSTVGKNGPLRRWRRGFVTFADQFFAAPVAREYFSRRQRQFGRAFTFFVPIDLQGAEKSFAHRLPRPQQPTSVASHGCAGVEPASVLRNPPNFSLGALIAGIIAARWGEGNTRLCAAMDFASASLHRGRKNANNEDRDQSPILEAVHAKSPRQLVRCIA